MLKNGFMKTHMNMIVSLLVLTTAGASFGAEVYVAPQGNDSAPGTTVK